MRTDQSRGLSRGLPFQNVSGETIPAYAVMAVVGVVHEQGVALLACGKPDTTFRRDYTVNGIHDVPAGRRGTCFCSGDLRVLLQAGFEPEPGQGCGPKPGQWSLAPGFPGFTLQGIAQAEHDVAIASHEAISGVLVKITAAVAPRATTADYRVHVGAPGSETDAGFTTVPEACNRTFQSMATDEWAWLAWSNDGWELQTAHNRVYPVNTTGAVADGVTVAVALPDGRTVTATNWSGAALSAGRAMAWQSFWNGNWYLMGARGGEPGGGSVWWAFAVDDIDREASGTVLLSSTDEVEAMNWSDDVDIKAGDRILVWQDAEDHEYYCLRAGYLKWFHALVNMEGGFDPSNAAVTVDNVTCLSDGSTPAITAIDNVYNLTGADNDDCLFVESPEYGTGYQLVQVSQPARKNARMFLATMGGTLLSTDSDASATTTSALDGGGHPGNITVQNTFGLAAANTAPVLVVEHHLEGDLLEYLLVQVPHTIREPLESVTWSSPNLTRTPRPIVVIDGGSAESPETVFTASECDP
jgi:hypothetical protein